MAERLFYDEVEVHDVFVSPARSIDERDVLQFAELTGDFTALHVDPDFAACTPFGRPIAHGLLGLSIVAGLGNESPLMETRALLQVRDWRFVRPIYFGDTVHVRTEALSKTPHGRKHGAICWQRQLINQDGRVVQEGIFETMVSRRPPGVPPRREQQQGEAAGEIAAAISVQTPASTL